MPAHSCGVYGFKPSYGRVSRFGLILYSSSSDVNGPLAHSTEDIHQIFKTIQGKDIQDNNCIDFNALNSSIYRDQNKSRVLDDSFNTETSLDLTGIRVGILEEFLISEEDHRNRNVI